MRISSYFADSMGNIVAVRSSCVQRIRDRYGLASGFIEYRPELWVEDEQLELFPVH